MYPIKTNKRLKQVSIFFVFSILLTFPLQSEAFIGSGAGTSADPYQVSDCTELQDIENHLNDNFILINDIDCDVSPFNSGSGFNPIGGSVDSFAGTLKGQDNIITGLFIDRSGSDNVGLFGYVDGGVIEDLGLEDINIFGRENTGGLVGYANAIDVVNIHTVGKVESDNENTGGLIGLNKGDIKNSYSQADITSTDWATGGLVGQNEGVIIDSYTTGNIFANGSWGAGGLVGNHNGQILRSYATGDVEAEGQLGGLVGFYDSGSIEESYATGDVTGYDFNSYMGGLVGFISQSSATVVNSYSLGNVEGQSGVGGLAGYISDGSVTNSFSASNVIGVENTGGLVGYQYREGSISHSYATGDVSASSSVGGLVGFNNEASGNHGEIINSYFWNHADNPSDCIGEDNGSGSMVDCNSITASQGGESYFFDIDNAPMVEDQSIGHSGWGIDINHNHNINNQYPFLTWQVSGASPVWYMFEAPSIQAAFNSPISSSPAIPRTDPRHPLYKDKETEKTLTSGQASSILDFLGSFGVSELVVDTIGSILIN